MEIQGWFKSAVWTYNSIVFILLYIENRRLILEKKSKGFLKGIAPELIPFLKKKDDFFEVRWRLVTENENAMSDEETAGTIFKAEFSHLKMTAKVDDFYLCAASCYCKHLKTFPPLTKVKSRKEKPSSKCYHKLPSISLSN